jgi:ABC-type polysaccharide/polyol phosphate transport system ATPase subunit
MAVSGDTESASAQPLIEVEGVSKKFARSLRRSLYYAVRDLGTELTGRSVRPELRRDEFWALQDISFSLRRGESLGIIGPNGAGKSTLLKIITGIIKPTTGCVRTRGRVQALIELSSGMSPILTGRENIYVRSALFGIPKAVIDERFDEIVRFAELENYVDMPVQNYSSGMRVKLGFAIAINVDPDVLILDEVLAVGDHRFRAKARSAMQELLNRDVALIFISHNLQQVQGITESAIWLDRGEVRGVGQSRDICAKYVFGASIPEHGSDHSLPVPMSRSLNMVTLDSIHVTRDGSNASTSVVIEEDDESKTVEVALSFTVTHSFSEEECYFILAIGSGDSYHAHTVIGDRIPSHQGGGFTRTFQVDFSMFHPGAYSLIVQLFPHKGVVSMLYGASVLRVVINSATPKERSCAGHPVSPAIGNGLGPVALKAKLVSPGQKMAARVSRSK